MLFSRPTLAFATTVLIPLLAGCSGGDSAPADRPATIPVTGEVTYQGKPVPGASITFVPVSSGKAAFGTTDEKGRYQLSTFQAGDGAVAGNYAVSITAFESADAGNQTSIDDPNYQPPDERKPPRPPANRLPKRYQSDKSSGLTAVVNAADKNNIPFELKD